MANRIKVSLTDFVEFAIKSGSPKLTRVRQVKSRGPYHPAQDFWKPLREEIVQLHKQRRPKGDLDKFLNTLSDDKKRNRYTECVEGYKRFLGRKTGRWFPPPDANWLPSGLRIRVSPELGLRFNGNRFVIKLYFKAEKLSKNRVDIILLLMHQVLERNVPAGTTFAILDVPRGKMFSDVPSHSLLPLLRGEAAAFKAIWDGIT